MHEPSPGLLRLVVADDSLLVREGVVRLLTARGFDVVSEAADGDELIRKVAGHKPDVAVIDIRMPPTGTDEGAPRSCGDRGSAPRGWRAGPL